MKLFFLLALLAANASALYNCTQDNSNVFTFPKDFLWTTATSAYQVEGAAAEDGRGPSTWDFFAHTPGKIADNNTGDVACDSYHKLDKDLEMLQFLGVKAYRFSISWSRIFPNGKRNVVNAKGVAYYHRLIDGLKKLGIQPLVTMYHWDLPQALQDEGGWLNREIVDWFGDYARFLYLEYGWKVKNWVTLNEPVSNVLYGYCKTMNDHAPGGFEKQCDWAPYIAGHNMILAHARAYRIYDDWFRPLQRGKVGIVNVHGWVVPASTGDVQTAEIVRHFQHFWFTDPIVLGEYPPLMRERVDALSAAEGRVVSRLPHFTEAEKKMVHGSTDFIGANYYITLQATTSPTKPVYRNWYNFDTYAKGATLTGVPTVPGGWVSNYPEGLYNILKTLGSRYQGIDIIVTENGCMDAKDSNGVYYEGLNDQWRVTYLQQHIRAVAKAMSEGVRIKGYTAWSLMDNFEWTSGFTNKFGLFHVDFTSPERTRTAKESARWFKSVVQSNSIDIC